MARARSSLGYDGKKLQEEIKGHRQELLGVEREGAEHQRAIAEASARREYLQDLIQAKGKMIARYGEMAGARHGVRQPRRPGRPTKAAKPVPGARRRRGRPAAAPVAVRATSKKFAALKVTDAAEQTLKAVGKPVHLRDIAAQLMAGGKKFRAKKPDASILTVLAKDKRFRNMGMNMWRLA